MGLPATDEWFSTTARRNRQSYIFATLILMAILALVAFVLAFFTASSKDNRFLILLIFIVPAVICSYFLTAQRLRDMGLSGWLALLWIPLGTIDQYVGGAASLAAYIILISVAGTKGPNRYGPDPLSHDFQ